MTSFKRALDYLGVLGKLSDDLTYLENATGHWLLENCLKIKLHFNSSLSLNTAPLMQRSILHVMTSTQQLTCDQASFVFSHPERKGALDRRLVKSNTATKRSFTEITRS